MNPRPPGSQPGALPTELPPPRACTGYRASQQGPVAQWIERWTSNPRAEVRFLPGPSEGAAGAGGFRPDVACPRSVPTRSTAGMGEPSKVTLRPHVSVIPGSQPQRQHGCAAWRRCRSVWVKGAAGAPDDPTRGCCGRCGRQWLRAPGRRPASAGSGQARVGDSGSGHAFGGAGRALLRASTARARSSVVSTTARWLARTCSCGTTGRMRDLGSTSRRIQRRQHDGRGASTTAAQMSAATGCERPEPRPSAAMS